MQDEQYKKALQDMVVSASAEDAAKDDVPALLVMNALSGMSGKSASETDLMASTRKFPRQFVGVALTAMSLVMAITVMQFAVCNQLHSLTSRIGLCFTLFGSTIALALLLLRLFYAQRESDGITRSIWFMFQFCIGTVVFGMMMWLLGFYWGIQPDFLTNELASNIYIQRMTQILGLQPFQYKQYAGLCFIAFWPVVALSYCALRLAGGAVCKLIRNGGSKPAKLS